MSIKPRFHRMYNYRRTLLPNEYLAFLEEGVADIESAKEKTGFSVGYPGWGLLYYTILCGLDRERENITVETGTNIGCSTIILAQALKDSGLMGHIYSCELEYENHQKAKLNIEKARLSEYVTLIHGDSIEFLKDLCQSIEVIRFAFLDSSHLQDHVFREFEIVYPRLGDEGLAFFDNTAVLDLENDEQQVNGALRKIKERYGGNLINFENTSWYTPGQAIWQKNGFAKDWK